ncbi:hypothetical protein SK128_014644, partial [Halocaridina rubra]
MYEALISQLAQGSLALDLADETKENLEILKNMSQSQEFRADTHAARQDDVELESLIANLFNQVEGSDMADYWRDLLTLTDALIQNINAVHICNWDEYVSSLHAILPWMIAYDNNCYERWLPDFRAMLTTLPADQ